VRGISFTLGVLTTVAVGVAPLVGDPARAQQVFQPRVDYEAVSFPFAVTAADVNNDGKADLIAASWDSIGISVHLGVGDGTFLPRLTSWGPGAPWQIAVGDLDGDPYPDIVAPEQSSVLVCHGVGDGTFSVVVDEYYPSQNGGRYVALGDFNGDGVDDIAMSMFSAPSGGITVFLSNGTGGFNGPFDYASRPGPEGIITVDVNADSKVDLVVANYGVGGSENSISVFLGNGNGTFQAKVDYGTVSGPIGVAAADFNGDSKIDVATCSQSGIVSILPGDGSGAFGAPTNYPVGFVLLGLNVADLNGDGKPDLVTSDLAEHGPPDKLQVLMNNGNGTFTKQDSVLTASNVNTLGVADFNNDGKSDVVASNGDYQNFPYPDGHFISVFLGCSPCVSTAVDVALEEIQVVDGHRVRATWLIPGGSSVLGTVQRKQDGGDWADLTSLGPLDIPRFTYEDATVTPGLRYAYRLSLRDQTDAWFTNEAWIFIPSVEAAPARLSLRAPFPNPSRAGVSFRIGQPLSGEIRLRVFDVRGREVARILGESRNAGWSDASWSGLTRARAQAPSGVYFGVLEGNGEVVRRKFVLAR